MTKTTDAGPEKVDTRLRPLNEIIARLITPVPKSLIDQLKDASKADYVNITSVKDLLDWACGHGRWRVEIREMLQPIHAEYTVSGSDKPFIYFGMIIRLHIQTEDEGWLYQDGTGSERLNGKAIYGDPLTNSYAQAVRRAAESFGHARELWRRKTIKAQATAMRFLADASRQVQELPKAPPDEEQADTGRGGDEYYETGSHEHDASAEDNRGDAYEPPEDEHEAAAPPAAAAGGKRGTPAAAGAGQAAKGAAKAAAGGGAGKKAAPGGIELANDGQIKAIRKIISEKYESDPEEECATHFGGRKLKQLTNPEAAAWLTALQRNGKK